MAPGEDVSTAVAKYVGAAQVQLEQRPDSDDPISIAWLLSDLGCDEAAERYALQMRDQFNDFLASPPQAMTTGEFEWRSGIFAAVRAAMGAIIAMRAVARGDLSTASAAADAAAADTKDYGWLALELSQRTQIEACVALGLHAAGASEAAQEHLAKALVDAPRLARRGELSSFRRLTQALVTLRPPGDAASIWATWLTAAAAASAENALFLIADYLRWLPSADIDGIGVQPATGELFTKPVASRPIQPRT
jgi:hypothetical protein